MRYPYRWMGLIVALILIGGCGPGISKDGVAASPADTATPYLFTDAMGRTVQVDNPQRVVAMMGSLAQTWMLAGGELAGATEDIIEWDMEIPPDLPLVGQHNNPSLEALVSLEPDFVILSCETREQVALKEALDNLQITYAYFSVTHFEQYLQLLEVFTGITGRKDCYEQYGDRVKNKIEQVLEKAPTGKMPEILLMITYSGGVRVQASNTMAGRMLKDLGCINIADSIEGLAAEFSMETVLMKDPDFIFLIPMGNNESFARRNLEEFIQSNPAWAELTAVQNNRYILLPKELFLYKPNHRWSESYEMLYDMLSDN